jgi:hypothetical protein
MDEGNDFANEAPIEYLISLALELYHQGSMQLAHIAFAKHNE